MTDIFEKILKQWVDTKWYLNNYNDVKNVGLDANSHYRKYGVHENRIPNPYSELKPTVFKIIFLLFHFCGLRHFNPNRKKNKIFQIFSDYFILIYLNYKLKNFYKSHAGRNKLYITSWVGGGVSDILPFYINRDLTSYDAVMVLQSIKDVAVSDMPIFKVSLFFKSEQNNESFVCVFPELFLKILISKQNFFSELQIHHVFGFEKLISFFLNNFKIKSVFYLHDYYLFSANWSFFEVQKSNNYMDSECNNVWEKSCRLFLITNVTTIVATSFHTYNLLLSEECIPKYKVDFQYNPEESNIENLPVRFPGKVSNEINILILGNLGLYKGLSILNSLMDLLPSDLMDLKFFHIGGVSEGFLSEKIFQYGWLDKLTRSETIRKIDADLVLVPAQCPETYSVIVSDILRLGIPMLASNIGAIPERLFDRRFTKLVNNYSNPTSWLNEILEFQRTKFIHTRVELDYSFNEKSLILSKRLRLDI
jgi:glycosyltransferase involved in cell wall biosynthesis